MKNLLKTVAIVGSFFAPVAAVADTTCNRSGLTGDWRLVSINPFGSTSACDLSFNNRGNFTGNCYSVEFDNNVPTQFFEPATGSITLTNSCAIIGSVTIGTEPEALTVDLTGRVWSSRGRSPMLATATGMVTMQGIPIVIGMDMHRRVWHSAPVPVAP